MESSELPHSEYYEAVGRGISAWQQVEAQLTGLFSRLLICAFHGTMMRSSYEHMWITSNILNSITNVNTRVDMVGSTFGRLVMDEALSKEWNSIKNKIKEKYKYRNVLAHWSPYGNEGGISIIGTPFAARKDDSYPAEQLKQWEDVFKKLADRIEKLAIDVNRYLVENPLPEVRRT
ncbi:MULTISPECIES: hypothetical protein [unclassified Brevundimonas]|uniref:hypothetical protein n=1 Tax=unclassified Brevundimonas TaxID=2622653 RepID=UPI0025BD7575|nr:MULTISPECIES: hypothetical protein [unclassified Brevundimonas]